jgi:ATP-dependent RNA helicase SUPV3L1/SUV3
MHIQSAEKTTKYYEDSVFPEIKQFHKIKSKLNITKESLLSVDFQYVCIKEKVIRRNVVVEDALFILEKDLNVLNEVIDEVSTIRHDKKMKKISNHFDEIKEKESKFNKIYDNNSLPVDTRKEAYNYFVLNKKSYVKNIKLNKILKFIDRKDIIETKKQKKDVKKILENIVNKNKDVLTLTDYGLMHKIVVKTDIVNLEFERNLNILLFKHNELKKYAENIKSDPEEAIHNIVKQKLSVITGKETKRINKVINLIKEHVDIRHIDREILKLSLEKVLDIYHRDDALFKFILNVFIQYSNKSEFFSKRQREIFSNRRKFRNRVQITINDYNFETCFYLIYRDFKKDFLNLLNNENFIDIKSFTSWIEITNDNLIKKKMSFAKSAFRKEVDKNYEKLILDNSEHAKILKVSKFKIMLEQFVLENLAREPENRRREISPSRINEIFIGEAEEIKNIIKQSLLDELMNIDYKKSFPIARKYKRKFKFFVGKTNSGKTYRAFNELVKYNSGAYLSPLRLLALEGQDEIEGRGKKCNMITGEERSLDKNAKFTSSTIEMLDLNNELDCIVIDEIQMLKDENRGWAWTQAVIGSPAKNIILTGSDEVLDLVKSLLQYTGDTLEVERLERKSPLKLLKNSVDIKNIRKGTAIIAFSRKDVLKYKSLLKDKKVSVIYGNLGPEVRQEEARKFRSGETEILVATDAIAMGLNLPIETVLFSTHTKNIRGATIEIDEQLLQQIAGRAGRYGLKSIGYVGALTQSTSRYVSSIMSVPIPDYSGEAMIMPNAEYLKQIQSVLKIDDFKESLDAFGKYASMGEDMFVCTDLSKMIELSDEIDKYSLSIEESLRLVSAPIRENNDNGLFYFNKYVEIMVENFYLTEDDKRFIKTPYIDKFSKKDKTDDSFFLKKAEEMLHILDLYNWFSLQYPNIFNDDINLTEKKQIMNDFIINSLQEINTEERVRGGNGRRKRRRNGRR